MKIDIKYQWNENKDETEIKTKNRTKSEIK